MPPKLNEREFDLFLSHAHADHEFVSALRRWLETMAGLEVWYDDHDFAAGSWLTTGLLDAVARCRGCVLVATEDASKSRYVLAEFNAAMNQLVEFPGFRFVALRVGNAPIEPSMKNLTWIDIPKPELDAKSAYKILHALYPDTAVDPSRARDIYISCTWHKEDGTSARTVSNYLVKEHNFRLIGDARDQKAFDPKVRMERIMSSCGAFIAILPFRDKTEAASASEGPYQYMLQEVDRARALKLPSIIIADPRVRRTDAPDNDWLRMETSAQECPPEVTERISRLHEDWAEPRTPHYVFCALDLDKDEESYTPLLRVIERVTGMEAIIKVDDAPVHECITRKLKEAVLVVADITDDNVNRCVEAGIAHAAGVKVELVARGERRKLPFMLRAMTPQLDKTYKDEVEQIGVFHRIVRPYRRRVINSEL